MKWLDAGTKTMSVSTFGTFIKLMNVQCTETWVSESLRDRIVTVTHHHDILVEIWYKKLPMSLRIEEGIWITEPCSSATQVISEDSDLYRPFKESLLTCQPKQNSDSGTEELLWLSSWLELDISL